MIGLPVPTDEELTVNLRNAVSNSLRKGYHRAKLSGEASRTAEATDGNQSASKKANTKKKQKQIQPNSGSSKTHLKIDKKTVSADKQQVKSRNYTTGSTQQQKGNKQVKGECNAFKTKGVCKYGDKCRYSHQPVK